jgi:hypothetical protein
MHSHATEIGYVNIIGYVTVTFVTDVRFTRLLTVAWVVPVWSAAVPWAAPPPRGGTGDRAEQQAVVRVPEFPHRGDEVALGGGGGGREEGLLHVDRSGPR